MDIDEEEDDRCEGRWLFLGVDGDVERGGGGGDCLAWAFLAAVVVVVPVLEVLVEVRSDRTFLVADFVATVASFVWRLSVSVWL